MPEENQQTQAAIEQDAGRAPEEPRRGDGSSSLWRETSWVSVVSGWLAALGAGLILGTIASGLVAAGFAPASGGRVERAGLFITVFLAFLIGGFVAGRMAGRYGFVHGILVPMVSLVGTTLLALLGLIAGISLMGNLSGVTLPEIPRDAQKSLDVIFSGTGILALLLFPFAGGAAGGIWGARTTGRPDSAE